MRQGLVLLGSGPTRRWVSLIALTEMGSDKPHELLVSAAVRARCCELLAREVGMGARASELFLLGALSLIDAMLDARIGLARYFTYIVTKPVKGPSAPPFEILLGHE